MDRREGSETSRDIDEIGDGGVAVAPPPETIKDVNVPVPPVPGTRDRSAASGRLGVANSAPWFKASIKLKSWVAVRTTFIDLVIQLFPPEAAGMVYT